LAYAEPKAAYASATTTSAEPLTYGFNLGPMFGVPRLVPGAHALFQLRHDCIGNAGVVLADDCMSAENSTRSSPGTLSSREALGAGAKAGSDHSGS
jgi:hypothetical protein